MLRVKDLVQGLNVCEATIRRWTKGGFLPDRRDRHGRRFFLEDDVIRAKREIYREEPSEGKR